MPTDSIEEHVYILDSSLSLISPIFHHRSPPDDPVLSKLGPSRALRLLRRTLLLRDFSQMQGNAPQPRCRHGLPPPC